MMLVVGAVLISNAQVNRFEISENKAEKRVDITVDGKPFTSYRYADSLKKPVLFPIHAAQGSLVTRGWPLDPRSGERMDHPHHVGLWFTYGDVNGLDFWNNSTSIPEEKKHEYGTIKHATVNKITTDQDQAELAVSTYWEKTDGTPVLKEDTRYIFTAIGERRAM